MDQDDGNRSDRPLAQAAGLAVAAVVSAILTATTVIAIGQPLIERSTATPRPEIALIRTGG
jgi:hypothetical protein